MKSVRDNKTRDLFGQVTPDERREARLRQVAHWVPVIRRLLQGSDRAILASSEKAQGAGGNA